MMRSADRDRGLARRNLFAHIPPWRPINLAVRL